LYIQAVIHHFLTVLFSVLIREIIAYLIIAKGLLAMYLAGAAIGSFVIALFVQLGTIKIAKFKPSYGMAYKAAFFSSLSLLIIGFVGGVLFALFSVRSFAVDSIALDTTIRFFVGLDTIIGFFLGAAIYGSLIKHPETDPIGLRRGLAIEFILLISFGLLMALPFYLIGSLIIST
jgi:hypothetical protein